MRDGVVAAVCVVSRIRPNPGETPYRTAIDKRPVDGPVHVAALGLVSDRVMDTEHHGGREQAVYVFDRAEQEWWQRELGLALPPGTFGENLTTAGIEVSEAVVGEQWRIGGDRPDAVVIEATMPRTPCATFANWMGQPGWIKRFSDRGQVGSYFRVVQPGTLAADDPIEIVRRPAHGVTVGRVFRGLDAGGARALVGAHESGDVELAPKVLSRAYRRAV